MGELGGKLVSLDMIFKKKIREEQRGWVYNLLDSFSGAFHCGTIPQSVLINGLRCPNPNGSCKVCKRICMMFPVERIGDIDLCLPIATSKELIKARLGGRDYLHSETRFMQLLGMCEISGRGSSLSIGFTAEVQDELKAFVELSRVDLSKLDPEEVVKAMKNKRFKNVGFLSKESVYLCEESFDYLKTEIGIPIRNDLVDPWAIRVENLDRMVGSVMEEKDSFFSQVDGLDKIDSLLKQQDPPIQSVLKSGILPKLVELLQRDALSRKMNGNLKLCNLSSSVLTKVASYLGKVEHLDEIVKSGSVPALVALMSLPSSLPIHTEIPINATRALGLISGKCPQYRDLVLQAGVLEPLVKRLGDHPTGNLKSVRTYVWLLSNLCRGKPKPDFNLASPPLETFNELIRHPDDEVIGYACCFLGYLCGKGSNNTQIQTMIDTHCNIWASKYHEYETKDIAFKALTSAGRSIGEKRIASGSID